MEVEVEITLIYSDEREAAAISSGVSPDNLETPEGLLIETRALDNKTVTSIKYRGENTATLLSTINDLLSCILTAERTLLAVKRTS
ncbi:MAG: KEOPS complex subunit Pcc1 [Candidatus Bathyarchaeia archaeon]|nr:hypothetical protein [Candidatus Bathyarchaeota archaeon]